MPPLLMPQASGNPVFLLRRGSSACDYNETGEHSEAWILSVLLQAPAGPAFSSPFVSHVSAVGEIEPSGEATEGKYSEKTDVQVLPVWDLSPQTDPFLSESTGNK